MAAAVGSYPSHAYHRPTYSNSTLPLFYHVQPVSNGYHQAPPHNHQQKTTPLTQIGDYVDSISPPLLRRREPRIRRQVIMLPTPEPIYRQVRHRLPTPERGVIQRTVVQKANGDVIVQQERHRKKNRSHSRAARSSRTRPSNADWNNCNMIKTEVLPRQLFDCYFCLSNNHSNSRRTFFYTFIWFRHKKENKMKSVELSIHRVIAHCPLFGCAALTIDRSTSES